MTRGNPEMFREAFVTRAQIVTGSICVARHEGINGDEAHTGQQRRHDDSGDGVGR